MLSWLMRWKRKQRRVMPQRRIMARYDAAGHGEDYRHWAAADALSAIAANSPDVRATLRQRARYEVANNCYAKGIVLTLANDVVGTGPRLQCLLPDRQLNAVIEQEFGTWAREVQLPEKLRTMRIARAQDGETFAMLITNPALAGPVKLDIQLIEADQVTTPNWHWQDQPVDGIELDATGNVIAYHVLRQHPGDAQNYFVWSQDYDRVPADRMLHWFRCDRPGQRRGIPDLTPALPLFAQLRRYTLAVLGAAETAASFAGILYTDAPPGGEADAAEPFEAIELERRALVTMPGGWKMSQLQAEQPATTYADFKHEIINEIARIFNMPFNIAACNSSNYNYASGRLDHQTYYRSIRVEQSHLEAVVLDPILAAWLDEALMVEDYLPSTGPFRLVHQWFWDGREHVDPLKEASAQALRLAHHTTTLAHEYARQGLDWEEALRQRAREIQLMRELGLGPEKSTTEVGDSDDADE